MSVPTKSAVLSRIVKELAYHAGIPGHLIKKAHKLKKDLAMNRQDLVRFTRALGDYMARKVPAAVPLVYEEVAKKGQTVGKLAKLVHQRFLRA